MDEELFCNLYLLYVHLAVFPGVSRCLCILNRHIRHHRQVVLDALLDRYPQEREAIEGMYEIVLETVLSTQEKIHIAKNDYPKNLVKAKLLKLNSMHVEYVLDCMKNNTTKIKKIRPYLLATLFNAPSTMSSYYQAEVNHDMACGLI